jgi:hypothetical protein
MLLKIGELAKRTRLTVRALHHYDAIGLLSPSVRSDAGYRLFPPRKHTYYRVFWPLDLTTLLAEGIFCLALNCVRYRWFVTEPHYVPALAAHFNTIAYHFDEARNACLRHESELEALRNGKPIEKMRIYRSRRPRLSVKPNACGQAR